MAIEDTLNRIATALERIAAAADGGEIPAKKGPGRPRKVETVEAPPPGESPAPAAAASPAASSSEAAPSTSVPAATPAPAPVSPAAPAPATAAPAAASADIPDVAIQKTVTALVQANRRDFALSQLKRFGAESASKLPQEHRNGFLLDAKAVLGTLPAEAAGYAP